MTTELTKTELHDLSDEELFALYKEGSREAFDLILTRYQNPIFSFIIKSVKNRQKAEELFQEVFYRVVEKRNLFQSAVSFKAWIYTICRNTCIDDYRKSRRRPQTDVFFGDEESDGTQDLPSDDINQEDYIKSNDLEALLNEAFKYIPPEQKETFYLRVKKEMTFEEVAEVMHCSTNTAKSRMRYALEHLRDFFRRRGAL